MWQNSIQPENEYWADCEILGMYYDSQIGKEFGFYVDPYLDANIHYSIKEPYKSMNDPDLIKIQEYFNKK